jgi:hypothetical protein
MANPARVNDLEQQLAHLRWKRWQNEREIRTKLNVGRSMRANDTLLKMSIDYAGERAMWMTSVVRDELSRPLVLEDKDMMYIQEEDRRARDRYVKNTTRQEQTLDRINAIIKEKEDRGQFMDPKAHARRLRKMDAIASKIDARKVEISKQMPIVHAKWSGHDPDIKRQQRKYRSSLL